MLKDEKVENMDILFYNNIDTIIKTQEHNGVINCDADKKSEIDDNDDKISDNDDKFVAKNRRILACDFCDYKTCRKTDYHKHILTRKHKNNDNSDKNDDNLSLKVVTPFTCICGKVYKYRQGLCYHKKNVYNLYNIHKTIIKTKTMIKTNTETMTKTKKKQN
jgi:hypothetical protein